MSSLQEVFDHQRELTKRFHSIERQNDLLLCTGKIPYDLTRTCDQMQLRQIAFDTIEELGEVFNAKNLDDARAELIDVAHFLIELCICSGITAEQIKLEFFMVSGTKGETALHFIRDLIMAMHYLKAKPWKANPKATDVLAYQQALKTTFFSFTRLCSKFGMTEEIFLKGYADKNVINHKRIDSGA